MPAPAAPRAPPPTLLVRWADRGPHERVMADSLRNAQAAPLARVLHPLDPGRLAMLPPPPAAAAVVMGPPARPVIDRSIEIGEIVVELGHSAPGWRPAPPPPAGALMAAVPSLRVGGGRR